MIITIRLTGKELEEIEKVVSIGEVGSINDFIKYAIQNQLQLEKEGENVLLMDKNSTLIEEKPSIYTPPFDISYLQRTEDEDVKEYLVYLDDATIMERTRYPIWALKNKFFPLKFVLRIIENMIYREDGRVSVKSLRKIIEPIAFRMKEEMDKLDKQLENKRGNRFSAGFPKQKEGSYDRFFKNFVVYISPDGETIKGMPWELGFIDVKGEDVYLTEEGYTFAHLHSPILDGYLKDKVMPNTQFSEDELRFLYKYIYEKVSSEKTLYEFMFNQIEKGINTPEDLNQSFHDFLERAFPTEDGYTEKSANSIRAGVTSRMVELGLIRIKKIGGKSYYEIGKEYKKFKEV